MPTLRRGCRSLDPKWAEALTCNAEPEHPSPQQGWKLKRSSLNMSHWPPRVFPCSLWQQLWPYLWIVLSSPGDAGGSGEGSTTCQGKRAPAGEGSVGVVRGRGPWAGRAAGAAPGGAVPPRGAETPRNDSAAVAANPGSAPALITAALQRRPVSAGDAKSKGQLSF